jgi:hypothetical protein
MVLRINSSYFPKQHFPVDLCNGECTLFFAVVPELSASGG